MSKTDARRRCATSVSASLARGDALGRRRAARAADSRPRPRRTILRGHRRPGGAHAVGERRAPDALGSGGRARRRRTAGAGHQRLPGRDRTPRRPLVPAAGISLRSIRANRRRCPTGCTFDFYVGEIGLRYRGPRGSRSSSACRSSAGFRSGRPGETQPHLGLHHRHRRAGVRQHVPRRLLVRSLTGSVSDWDVAEPCHDRATRLRGRSRLARFIERTGHEIATRTKIASGSDGRWPAPS